jgi:hypothetical protein
MTFVKIFAEFITKKQRPVSAATPAFIQVMTIAG